MNRYLALKGKDKFDISKFTVVGSPTITSDGVASGFSNGQIYSTVNLGDAKVIKIFMRGQYYQGANFATLFWFATNENRSNIVRLGVGASGNIVVFASGVVCSVNKSSLNPINNEWLEFIVTIDTTLTTNNIKLEVIKNKTSYESVGTYTIVNPKALNLLYWGTNSSGIEYSYGSIDLTKFKITVDNQLVFQPVKPTRLLERRKEGFDLSKFTVVGSPTITEYGVASGFSNSNYVQINKVLSNDWGFILPVKITNDATSLQGIARFYSANDDAVCQIRKEGARVYIAGFGGAVGNFAFNPTYTLNQTIYLKAVKNGNSLTLSYSSNLIDWNDSTFDLTGYTVPDVSRIVLGVANPSWVGLQGSIDLTQFSITVAGKEVFTGAKESYYILRS